MANDSCCRTLCRRRGAAGLHSRLMYAAGRDAATLMRNADVAMYKAKSTGRNTYQFYTENLGKQAFQRVRMQDSPLRMPVV